LFYIPCPHPDLTNHHQHHLLPSSLSLSLSSTYNLSSTIFSLFYIPCPHPDLVIYHSPSTSRITSGA
jgi:hypothetical protein